MRVLQRGITAAAALLLVGSALSIAHADDPPRKGEAAVTCPTDAQIDAVLGGTTTSSDRQANGCWYERPAGSVAYQFQQGTLAQAREQAESAGTDFTEFPDLGGFGQSYSDSIWRVNFPVGDGEVVSMVLPLGQKDVTPALGTLFKEATAPWPGVTVAPQPFTATCPPASGVSRIAGITYTFKPDQYRHCNYVQQDGGTIEFSIDDTYGSVVEARTGTELSFKFVTSIRTFDFSGLGDGAYAWADASPVFLTWQLRDGVVARMSGGETTDQTRRLAQLFEDAQETGSGSPPSPGLPSTGN